MQLCFYTSNQKPLSRFWDILWLVKFWQLILIFTTQCFDSTLTVRSCNVRFLDYRLYTERRSASESYMIDNALCFVLRTYVRSWMSIFLHYHLLCYCVLGHSSSTEVDDRFFSYFLTYYFGCDYHNSMKKIILTMLPRGDILRGLLRK